MEEISLTLSSTGHLTRKSQITDYQYHGIGLQTYNFWDFLVQTYEEKESRDAVVRLDDVSNTSSARGHPINIRVPYNEGHPEKGKKTRVIRGAGNNCLPNFIGKWFPRNDDNDQVNLHCAMMLALLKPWHVLEELKMANTSWQESLEQFLDQSSNRYRNIISSIQHYHRCKTATDTDHDDNAPVIDTSLDHEYPSADEDHRNALENDEDQNTASVQQENITAQDITDAKDRQTTYCERVYARDAVDIARGAEVFAGCENVANISGTASIGQSADLSRLDLWRQRLQCCVHDEIPEEHEDQNVISTDRVEISDDPDPTVTVLPIAEDVLSAVHPDELLTDQRRAFDIVAWHLMQTMQDARPRQLLLQIQGEGGTGKSKVIQTITNLFKSKGMQSWLIKSAYTGIAASLIGGDTTHRIGGLTMNGKQMGAAGKAVLEDR